MSYPDIGPQAWPPYSPLTSAPALSMPPALGIFLVALGLFVWNLQRMYAYYADDVQPKAATPLGFIGWIGAAIMGALTRI
jgi:hypothetical protein